ncbi:MAG: DUF91 domain-containing protein [FCB group bacterium]|nr:DUF91 domain-containing protein [FCB group bacterium]
MKSYYRFMLGKGSIYADEGFNNNFVGVDNGVDRDMSDTTQLDRKSFNNMIVPLYMDTHPEKPKAKAHLSSGVLFRVVQSINEGDIIICPDGAGRYHVGEVTSGYTFNKGHILPHQRPMKWYPNTIQRVDMSDALRGSTGATGTIVDITKYADELEQLFGGQKPPVLIHTDETVEDPTVFALERHLEDFLVKNWHQTDLSKRYDIFEDEGELIGQQYEVDTGRIDILAISKDKKELLVVELKKGRASDVVVGQIQRYMGYVVEELADEDQSVRGVIIALEDDIKLRRSLVVAPNIAFYRYQVSFKLFEG